MTEQIPTTPPETDRTTVTREEYIKWADVSGDELVDDPRKAFFEAEAGDSHRYEEAIMRGAAWLVCRVLEDGGHLPAMVRKWENLPADSTPSGQKFDRALDIIRELIFNDEQNNRFDEDEDPDEDTLLEILRDEVARYNELADDAEYAAGECYDKAQEWREAFELGQTNPFGDYMIDAEVDTSLEKRAAPFIEALSAKFPGATFELVSDTVMCTDGNGVDVGDPGKDDDPARSWDSVMMYREDERFIVTVGGERYDSRGVMTKEAYGVLVQFCKDNDRPLPDSECNNVSIGGGHSFYSCTLLTGNPELATGSGHEEWRDADSSTCPVAMVLGDKVELDTVPCDDGVRLGLVRPGIKIPV